MDLVDIGTSAHLYWRMKKMLCRVCLFSYCFFGNKNNNNDLCFHPSIIKFKLEENLHTKAVVDVCRSVVGKVFLFSSRDWERAIRNLLSLVNLYQRTGI